MNRRILAAILDALRLDGQRGATALSDAEWRDALEYCNRHQLTLPLARSLVGAPGWVTELLERNATANRQRTVKQLELYERVGGLVLKGFSHWPYLCPDPELRTQYDLDLYCPRAEVEAAQHAALELGYEPMEGRERFPTDHLPPLIRKTGWTWRGDYFDVEIPTAIELHFQFWDREVERFGPVAVEGFWKRREVRQWKEFRFTALSEADSLGYACLHGLRHLLRGDARAANFYEVAWFLERQQDPLFWDQWLALHDDSLREIEAVCFRLARDWFGCRLSPVAQAVVDGLPAAFQTWFEHWGRSPLEVLFRPNKDELWLHLSLLQSARDRVVVLRRRLLPLKAPGEVYAIHAPEVTIALRLKRKWRYARYVVKRVAHHARVLVPLAGSGARWWLLQSGLSGEYWRFYAAFVIFNFSLMIFYLLYNLHLASLGFDESFAGRVTSVMHTGSLLGSLIAGVAAARAGLRTSLAFSFVATGVSFAQRAVAPGASELLALAFQGGLCQSVWAVCLAPTVTSLAPERSRPLAFGLTFGTGVGLGVLAGLVGGRLPVVLGSTRGALLVAACLAPVAVLPLLWLRLEERLDTTRKVYAMSPFLWRFLGALAIWGAATGAFNPFFNLFFSRALHFDVEKIGFVYSATQGAQVLAMLMSPVVLRRFGVGPAIALMQAATGVSLAGLGLATPMLAPWMYGMYMAFQYMSEPGMYNLLMSTVPASERTGASALNFITIFGSQAMAAWVSGEAIARYGYRPVLLAAGVLALVAARVMMSITRSR